MSTEIKEGRSAIIFIRHGQSEYTHQGRDLTTKGVAQVQKTAHELSPMLAQFDQTMVFSSPRHRALGSAHVFLEALNQPIDNIRHINQIRSNEVGGVGDLIWEEMRQKSPYGGTFWVNDPIFQETLVDEQGRVLIEGRRQVEQRAQRFLRYVGAYVKGLEEQTANSIGILAFTHCEVIMPLMKGIFPNSTEFPQDQPIPDNGESLIIKIDNPMTQQYTFYGRGIKSIVRYNDELGVYLPVELQHSLTKVGSELSHNLTM